MDVPDAMDITRIAPMSIATATNAISIK